jgi:hypothetical protein
MARNNNLFFLMALPMALDSKSQVGGWITLDRPNDQNIVTIELLNCHPSAGKLTCDSFRELRSVNEGRYEEFCSICCSKYIFASSFSRYDKYHISENCQGRPSTHKQQVCTYESIFIHLVNKAIPPPSPPLPPTWTPKPAFP